MYASRTVPQLFPTFFGTCDIEFALTLVYTISISNAIATPSYNSLKCYQSVHAHANALAPKVYSHIDPTWQLTHQLKCCALTRKVSHLVDSQSGSSFDSVDHACKQQKSTSDNESTLALKVMGQQVIQSPKQRVPWPLKRTLV